jgi:O-antigen/teichoic acid export membrane protein
MLTVKSSMTASALLIATQLTKRLVSVVSMIILARILEPADFGLVAISLLFMNFVQVVSTTGGGSYLLSRESLTNEMVFTSWTLSLIIKGTLALILAVSSFFVAQYYEDARLMPLVIVLAIQLLIENLGSPGMIYKRKNQEFGVITKWGIVIKVISASVTITIAYVYESYWALVIGQFINALIAVILTYHIAPLKPKLTLVNFHEQWAFSKWILPQSLLNFFKSQIDAIIVSSMFDKASFGAYNSMRYYATIPVGAVINPAISPLLTQFSEFKSNKNYFLSQTQVVIIVLVAICTPIIYFMQQHAQFAVNLILGEKWVEYYPLFTTFAFLTIIMSLNKFLSHLLMLKDRTKFLFIYSIFTILVQVILFSSVEIDSVFELANYKIAADIFSVSILFFMVIKSIFGLRSVFTLILLSAPSPLFILVSHYITAAIISNNSDSAFVHFLLNVALVSFLYISFLAILITRLKKRVDSFHYIYNLIVNIMFNGFKKGTHSK